MIKKRQAILRNKEYDFNKKLSLLINNLDYEGLLELVDFDHSLYDQLLYFINK